MPFCLPCLHCDRCDCRRLSSVMFGPSFVCVKSNSQIVSARINQLFSELMVEVVVGDIDWPLLSQNLMVCLRDSQTYYCH